MLRSSSWSVVFSTRYAQSILTLENLYAHSFFFFFFSFLSSIGSQKEFMDFPQAQLMKICRHFFVLIQQQQLFTGLCFWVGEADFVLLRNIVT